MAETFDAIVIGSGPAGGEAAEGLVDGGRSVALIERDGFGGVCPLRGCNPKKVLLGSAEVMEAARLLRGKGIVDPPTASWADLMRFKRTFTEPISNKVENYHREHGAEVVRGRARFTGPDTVEVTGRILRADHFVVAVGDVPRPLDIPGANLAATSDDFLDLDELPRRIIFIGGGFVAFELAHIAARLGAAVTLLHHNDRPLKQFDGQLVDLLVDASRAAGIAVRLSVGVTALRRGANDIEAVTSMGPQHADLVVNCTGRVPTFDGLGLDDAGIAHSRRGITVDSHMRSVSNPKVFACGDAADTPYALTPTATIEARTAVRNILENGGENGGAVVDHTGIPGAVFSVPPLAAVGLTEDAARKQGVRYSVRSGELSNFFPWKRLGETHAAWRLLVDDPGEHVLGAHILGHMAEEMANLFALIIRQKIPISAVKDTVWTYPTCVYYLGKML